MALISEPDHCAGTRSSKLEREIVAKAKDAIAVCVRHQILPSSLPVSAAKSPRGSSRSSSTPP